MYFFLSLALVTPIPGTAQQSTNVYPTIIDANGHTWGYGRNKGALPDTTVLDLDSQSDVEQLTQITNILVKLVELQNLQIRDLEHRVTSLGYQMDSLQSQPVIYIDRSKPNKPQLWVKCPDGSCDIFIRKL